MNTLKYIPQHILKFTYIVFSLFLLNSCIKEKINLDKISTTNEINGTISLPIANGELTMKDIIKSQDSVGIVNFYPTDSLLYLQYHTNIYSKKAEEFIILNDQSFGLSIQLSKIKSTAKTSAIISDTSYIDFGVNNGEEIDSIFLKNGILHVNFKSTFHNTGNISFTIPDLTKDGTALNITIPISVSDGSFTAAITKDLSGYVLRADKKSAPNQLKILSSITLVDNGVVLPTYGISVTGTMNNLTFSKLFGYLGNRVLFDDTGIISMNVFDVKDQSKIEFYDPRIKITTRNSYGVPMRVDFHDMKTYSVLNDQFFTLNFTTPYMNVNAAESFTKPSKDSIQINKSNSNFAKAMATVPRDLYYGIKATLNPSGKLKNFISDTSSLKVGLEVELPLEVKISQYDYNDTINFDLGSTLKDFSIIDSLSIFMKIQNKLPIDVEIQFILTDDNMVAVDTLFTSDMQPVIASGTLATKGDSLKTIVFTKDRILQFKRIKKAIMKVALYTPDNKNTFVKFYLANRILISMGIRATIKVNSTDQL